MRLLEQVWVRGYCSTDIFYVGAEGVLPAPHRLTMEWTSAQGTPRAVSQYKHCVCVFLYP